MNQFLQTFKITFFFFLFLFNAIEDTGIETMESELKISQHQDVTQKTNLKPDGNEIKSLEEEPNDKTEKSKTKENTMYISENLIKKITREEDLKNIKKLNLSISKQWNRKIQVRKTILSLIPQSKKSIKSDWSHQAFVKFLLYIFMQLF